MRVQLWGTCGLGRLQGTPDAVRKAWRTVQPHRFGGGPDPQRRSSLSPDRSLGSRHAPSRPSPRHYRSGILGQVPRLRRFAPGKFLPGGPLHGCRECLQTVELGAYYAAIWPKVVGPEE